MPGTLYLVATPIGNLDDMPPRVAATFGLADFVAAEDTRVTLRLLNHLGLKKPMVSYYEHALHHGEAILNRIEAGENCALCSDAGMPCISDPGEQIVREALTNAKLWDVLQPQVIQGASVRQVLDYVARGEVDAGFVYGTDAKQQAGKVDVVLVVPGHKPVLYPIAVATTGKNPKMGQAFLDFVLSPEGQAVLAKYGFSKP